MPGASVDQTLWTKAPAYFFSLAGQPELARKNPCMRSHLRKHALSAPRHYAHRCANAPGKWRAIHRIAGDIDAQRMNAEWKKSNPD
jgi:hypothetical protein